MRFARFLTLSLLSAALAGLRRCQRRAGRIPGAVGHPTAEQCRLRRSRAAPRRNPAVVEISALRHQVRAGRRSTAPADTPFQVEFENKDAGRRTTSRSAWGTSNGAELFKGEEFTGVATRVYDVPALDAGAYAFVCTVHPTMTGTLTAE